MRIAIDALGIHGYGGGRTATINQLKGLLTFGDRNIYHVFLSQPEPSLEAKTGIIKQVICPFKNRILMRAWAQLLFPIVQKEFDLIHFTKNLGVFGLRIPSVVTVYDLTTLLHPELFPQIDVWYWKNIEAKTLQRARKVIAISKTTAHDIEQFYSIPGERIRVIYPSIDPRFKPASPAQVIEVRKKYRLPDSYILHVGRIDLKKNLPLVTEAYALAKKGHSAGFPEGLVLVGEVYKKGKDETLQPTIERLGLRKEVIFTGGIPDEDLPAIMTGAWVAVSASIHEGFGLAPIESMACGIPVIAYNAGALQETAGEGAYLIDDLNQENLAGAFIKLISEPGLRDKLSQQGIIQAQCYQRDLNAHQILDLYEEVVNEDQKRSPTYTE